MRNPYQTLGISPDATEADVKRAFRALVKRYHPDLAPNDPRQAARFREIKSAYDLLRDKRAEAAGKAETAERPDPPPQAERPPRQEQKRQERKRPEPKRQDAADGPTSPPPIDEGSAYPTGPDTDRAPASIERWAPDLSAPLARVRTWLAGLAAMRQPRQAAPVRSRILTVEVSFVEAARGTEKRVRLPGGAETTITIPPGTQTGARLPLPRDAVGRDGPQSMRVRVRPHPIFRREGLDVTVSVPIRVDEALFGAEIEVPTLDGAVRLSIPAGSNTDARLRLRGKGIRRSGTSSDAGLGDQVVTLKVVLPSPEDRLFVESLARWRETAHRQNPRAGWLDGAAD